MSDYTPTEYDMCEAWKDSTSMLGVDASAAEFDRFIAKVKADAWAEGYETGCSSPYGTATPSGKPYDPEPNPHRIEGEA